MLNGLMSAQLNVGKVSGLSEHGIHQQNSYNNVIFMKFDVARVLKRCFGLDLAIIHEQDWCHWMVILSLCVVVSPAWLFMIFTRHIYLIWSNQMMYFNRSSITEGYFDVICCHLRSMSTQKNRDQLQMCDWSSEIE